MRKYYRSKEIYTLKGVIDGFLVTEGTKIADVIPYNQDVAEFTDYGSEKILPGIFDTHNHGTNGWSMLRGYAADDILTESKGYLEALVSQGVTSVLPTASIEFFSTLADLKEQGFTQGAEIIGIHSEGPWLNRVGEKGAKPSNPYPPVDLKTAQEMVRLGRGYLKMVGMAPEIPGIDVIRDYFKQQNVTIAIAHTDGNYAVTKNAIANGATVATHLCNVMTGIHHRDFGCLGACLTDQRVWAELICDGLHVCNEMLKFVYDTKGKEQIMMISDCTALSGLKPGFYENEVLGGRISVTADGFVLDENGRLRGSSMPVIHGMRNLVVNCHIPLNDVVRMASYNPAAFHGCLAEKGSLEPGKDADFIIVNDDLRLISTFKAGNKCFDVKEGRNYFSPYIMRKLEKEI